MPSTTLPIDTLPAARDAVRSTNALVGGLAVRAGGTKPALIPTGDAVTTLDLSGLRGILEYQPSEYTFTALAGTPLAVVQAALAEHGQYLPFDPPLVEAGATLGGTIASGLSGSGRYRYGGVRDFLLGVKFIDGRGQLVQGGGKVVKNAAGFDLPKLLVGSLGRLGVMVEATFKVFPQPPAYATLVSPCDGLAEAVAHVQELTVAPVDIDALDVVLAEDQVTLHVRIGGLADVLDERLRALQDLVGAGEMFIGETEKNLWRAATELTQFPDDAALVRVATTTETLPTLDSELAAAKAVRRYAVAGNLAWIAWPGNLDALDNLLHAQNLPGLVLRGAAETPLLGRRAQGAFLQRIQQALDPEGKFGSF